MRNFLAAGVWVLVVLLLLANILMRVAPLGQTTIAHDELLESPQRPQATSILPPADEPSKAADTRRLDVEAASSKPGDQSVPDIVGTTKPVLTEPSPMPPQFTSPSTELLGAGEPSLSKESPPQTRLEAPSIPEFRETTDPALSKEPTPPRHPMTQSAPDVTGTTGNELSQELLAPIRPTSPTESEAARTIEALSDAVPLPRPRPLRPVRKRTPAAKTAIAGQQTPIEQLPDFDRFSIRTD